jgi:hypothetical protein
VMARDLLAASGLTEADLIAALRDAPLVKVPGDESVGARSTGTVTGHSLASNAAPGSRRGRAAAFALAVAALGTGIVSMLTIRHRTAAGPPPAGIVSTPTIESAPALRPPATPPTATPVDVPSPIVPVPSSTPSALPRAATQPAHPPKKKPVATTPGF